MSRFAGIDFGTSGARLAIIDDGGQLQFERVIAYSYTAASRNPQVWRTTLFDLLDSIPTDLKRSLKRLAIDGTSGSIVLCDRGGTPLLPPQMYCDRGHPDILTLLRGIAPPDHIVLSLSSSLCKYLSWQQDPAFDQACYLLHQADWLAAQLHGVLGVSDYHNSLKLGFDPDVLRYPDWFSSLMDCDRLPTPRIPGEMIDRIIPRLALSLGLSNSLEVVAGTTDSIAAFLASGAREIGDAVTSLGSTIALKLLSQVRVDSSRDGVYSHWFGENWLVGGASNAGGAILRRFFSPDELEQLSHTVPWDQPAIAQYIPLCHPGERFPVNDPLLQPNLDPRPDDDALFLHAILVSLTRIEQDGYCKLSALGASPLRRLFTAGGGTQNSGWMQWRTTQFDIPVLLSSQTQAAYGVARLACQGLV